jgi:tetratricopeptide (TPR) repeat protein
MMKIGKYIFCLSIFLLIINCELQDGITPPDENVEELVNEGWEQFKSGNYQLALETFQDAIARDNNYAEAYNGAGWASARLTNLSNAVSYFTQCISLNASLVTAHAGLAFVYNAQKEYESAINSANKALSLRSNWLFTYDESIGYKDLHLILAASYFALGNFSQSLAQVQKLNPSFTADFNTYEGKSALAEEIERLRGIV